MTATDRLHLHGRAAATQEQRSQTDAPLVRHLENIIGNLGSALRQQIPSDDKIIMDNVREAYEAAQKALIVVRGRNHEHAAGTLVGKHIDECAICGHDIRHEIHRRMERRI